MVHKVIFSSRTLFDSIEGQLLWISSNVVGAASLFITYFNPTILLSFPS